MKKINIIVAMSENGVIGDDNQLLWHLPNDLKQFKKITMGHPIIMGRKTYESIGKPLPGRQNIILTHARYLRIPDCEVVNSVNQALDATKDAMDVMVIGGGEIYRLFLPLATRLYITYVHTHIKGEVTFSGLNLQEWEETAREKHLKDDKHAYDYSFVTLVRRSL